RRPPRPAGAQSARRPDSGQRPRLGARAPGSAPTMGASGHRPPLRPQGRRPRWPGLRRRRAGAAPVTGQRERERDAGGVDRRFPLFDSLRAIAALSVLAGHVAIYEPMPNNLRLRFLALTGGIAVFFVISGFLLYRPLVRARFDRAEPPRTAAYAVRRVLRIGPAYWFALPIVVLLVGTSGEAPNATPVFTGRGIPAYFGFLQVYDSRTLFGGISAAWTLCVE